jgi:hypothetical protein
VGEPANRRPPTGYVDSYRELRVYQGAIEAAMRVFDLAGRCGYLVADGVAELDDRYDKIISQLILMAAKPVHRQVG